MDAVAHVPNRPSLDLKITQMGQGFPGGEAVAVVLDPAAEQDGKAVDRAMRLGEALMERVEAIMVAMGKRIETGVETGEGLAVRGEDQETVGEGAKLVDRGEPVTQRIAFGLAEAQ